MALQLSQVTERAENTPHTGHTPYLGSQREHSHHQNLPTVPQASLSSEQDIWGWVGEG